jgi:hypothetical protein
MTAGSDPHSCHPELDSGSRFGFEFRFESLALVSGVLYFLVVESFSWKYCTVRLSPS